MNLSFLQVSISAVTSTLQSNTPLEIDVSIRNNAQHPVTILTWDSPLDPKAGLLGIFELVNLETKESVPLATARLARELPPSSDSFVEIKGQKDYKSSTTLPTVDLGLPDDTEYRIEVKGSWRSVWNGTKAEIGREALESVTGGTAGEYNSNEIRVKIQSS